MRRILLGLSVLLVLAGCGGPDPAPADTRSESARILDQVVAQIKARKTMHAEVDVIVSAPNERAVGHVMVGQADIVLRQDAAPDVTATWTDQDLDRSDDISETELVVADGLAHFRSAPEGRLDAAKWTRPDPERPSEAAARSLGAATFADPLSLLDTGLRNVPGEVRQAPVYKVLEYDWDPPSPELEQRWSDATLGTATSMNVTVLIEPDGRLHSLKATLFGTALHYSARKIEFSKFGEPVTVTAP